MNPRLAPRATKLLRRREMARWANKNILHRRIRARPSPIGNFGGPIVGERGAVACSGASRARRRNSMGVDARRIRGAHTIFLAGMLGITRVAGRVSIDSGERALVSNPYRGRDRRLLLQRLTNHHRLRLRLNRGLPSPGDCDLQSWQYRPRPDFALLL